MEKIVKGKRMGSATTRNSASPKVCVPTAMLLYAVNIKLMFVSLALKRNNLFYVLIIFMFLRTIGSQNTHSFILIYH